MKRRIYHPPDRQEPRRPSLATQNARFCAMTAEGRVGSYSFDFDGDLVDDSMVAIKVAVANLKVVEPEGTSAQVRLEVSLSRVSTSGGFTQSGNRYVNQGQLLHQLTIMVDMTLGNLELSTR